MRRSPTGSRTIGVGPADGAAEAGPSGEGVPVAERAAVPGAGRRTRPGRVGRGARALAAQPGQRLVGVGSLRPRGPLGGRHQGVRRARAAEVGEGAAGGGADGAVVVLERGGGERQLAVAAAPGEAREGGGADRRVGMGGRGTQRRHGGGIADACE
jgi:hypothetical protein